MTAVLSSIEGLSEILSRRSSIRWVGFDTETVKFSPGNQAPPLVSVALCALGEEPGRLCHWTESFDPLWAMLSDPNTYIVGANVAFDMRVICNQFPQLLPLVWDAYRAGRIHDTQIAEKLLDIARGTFRRVDPRFKRKLNYALADQALRYLGMPLDKSEEGWRTRYGEIRHLPIKQWPAEAAAYARTDGFATIGVWERLMFEAVKLAKEVGYPQLLCNEAEQCASAWALGLESCYGLRTNAERVAVLEHNALEKLGEIEQRLIDYGFIDGGSAGKGKGRKPYDPSKKAVKNKTAVAEVLLEAAREKQPNAPIEDLVDLTDKGEELLKAGSPVSIEHVSVSADACENCSDPRVRLYGKLGAISSILSKDVPTLRDGVFLPIHTRFDLAGTGRTTSSNPNVQNWASKIAGVRECFEPRAGWLYAAADVGGLELATLAECALRLVGWSKLAEAINAGRDAHCDLASRILGIDPDEGMRRHKLGKELDKEFYLARQTAKVANFGFPGGLGIDSLIAYARALYKVILTPEQAKSLKALWLEQWPEMRLYFKIMADVAEKYGRFVQIGSGRMRGGLTYTSACNTPFQGLGSDAMKRVCFELTAECWDYRLSSILYGSRPVNFIHDENIVEVRDDEHAAAKAVRLADCMNENIKHYLPNVRATAEPVLMRVWSKDAKPVFDAKGTLIPWEPKKAA